MCHAWHSCRRQFSPKFNRKSWSLNERPSAQKLWIPMPKCWNILTDSFWVVHQNLPKFQKLNFDENISEKLITYELWVQQHQFLEIFNKMSKRVRTMAVGRGMPNQSGLEWGGVARHDCGSRAQSGLWRKSSNQQQHDLVGIINSSVR